MIKIKNKKKKKIIAAKHDSAWKDVIDVYFCEFMEFFYPALAKLIDWSVRHEFLDKELQAILPKAMHGKRFVDKLVKVKLLNGDEQWLQIHIEIQGAGKKDFNQRLYIYHYRLYDCYRRPTITLVILTDGQASWRPTAYREEVVGMEVVTFRFLSTKLLDYREKKQELEQTSNPFGLVVLACLAVLDARKDSKSLFEYKSRFTRQLYNRGLKGNDIWNLYKFIDWVITLPKLLEIRYNEFIHELEEEYNMAYITTAERIGIERGMQQGMQQGRLEGLKEGELKGEYTFLLRLLEHKFGEVPTEYHQHLMQADTDVLLAWGKRVLNAGCIEDVFNG
jgi:flagellar biosynthesis/type III secretory pathway protein FliH